MRILANLFLTLFCADGLVSLLADMVNMAAPVAPLSALRNLLGSGVLLSAASLYICLGIDRRLPKRVFLPLIFFVFCAPLLTWLIPGLASVPGLQLLLSLAQVGSCALPWSHFHQRKQPSLLIPPQWLPAPAFSLSYTFTFLAVNLLVLPLAGLVLLLSTADSYTRSFTSGFVRVGPDGIHMTERIYGRGNKIVRLAAMIHIGEKEYYDQMARSVGLGTTIVLAEGVTDRKHLLANRLDYRRMAGYLGLTSQDKMLFKGHLIDEAEWEEEDAAAPAIKTQDAPADIVRADVDVSSFRKPTIAFLDAFARHMQASPTLTKGFLAFSKWAEQNFTPQMQTILMEDILHRRNAELLRHLGKALTRYDAIVIPWGALHMPEIENALLKQGFIRQQERERTSVKWHNILRGRL